MSDAVIALDLATDESSGAANQAGRLWNVACNGDDNSNCPEDAGPGLRLRRHSRARDRRRNEEARHPDGAEVVGGVRARSHREGTVVWKKKLGTGGLLAASSGASQRTTATSTSRSPTSSSSTSRGSRDGSIRRRAAGSSRWISRRGTSAGTRRRRTAAPGRSAARRSHRRQR